MVRQATPADVARVAALYDAIHAEEEAGRAVIGWDRRIYPTRDTAEQAAARGELFVMEEAGQTVAAAILNQTQVAEYAACAWQYPAPDDQVLVLHTLVVDPAMKGRGYGAAFVAFYETYARARGCTFLRMDTNEKNLAARHLYHKLGYAEPGIVRSAFHGLPDVHLVCLEKKL